MAGFTTVRNLGLMVYTAGFMLDVDLAKAVDQGWFPGPRIIAAGHAITPTGGHLDPTMFQGLAPGIMPQSVEQGIANGVAEVRKAVRYQIKYGVKVIKISASGGVMSFSSAAGAQQYSDEELAAIVDEAHRVGLRVAAHAHGDAGIRGLPPRRGRLHRARLARDRRDARADGRAGHLPRRHVCPGRPHGDRPDPSDLPEEGGRDLSQGPTHAGQGQRVGVKIACGSDAPAIPHGTQADELIAMVDRGMTPMQALRAATLTSAELIEREQDLGRLAPGYLADIIAVPGDPSQDIKVTKDVRFVMKDGDVYKNV